jgi:ribosomal-protein-alanine N-acetyltransferase
VKIIPAQPENIEELISIQTECGLSVWTSKDYYLEMRRQDSIILAASDPTGVIAGFIVGRAARPMEGRPFLDEAEIYNIGSRQVFRKQGIGSRLIGQFIRICTERRNKSIWLEVRAGNREAISFYTSHGFVPMATRRNFYTCPTEDAVVMALQLAGHHAIQDPKGA